MRRAFLNFPFVACVVVVGLLAALQLTYVPAAGPLTPSDDIVSTRFVEPPNTRNCLVSPSSGAAEFLPVIWVALLLVAIYGAVWTQAPKPTGLCRICGYDLRATPDRCPECGQTTRAA